MSNDLINKVITSTSFGESGGLLTKPQANKFIDYIWDSRVLAGQVRTEKMSNESAELERIGVGRRLLRVSTEGVDDGMNVRPAFTKVSLTTTKYRLDWEITSETLEDNIEGEDFEDHIVRLFANQVGIDMEDIAINGDTSLVNDPSLKGLDGWAKRGRVDGAVIDHAGAEIDRALLSKMVKMMPRQYTNRSTLRFFANGALLQDYSDLLTTLVEENGADPLARFNVGTAGETAGYTIDGGYGVKFQEVPLMEVNETNDTADVWLTFPKNLIWGVRRELKVYRQFNQKTDSIEYTLHTRFGASVEAPDAFVVATNVKLKG